MKGSGLRDGRLRLDIEPTEGGMCNRIIAGGRPYDRTAIVLKAGSGSRLACG